MPLRPTPSSTRRRPARRTASGLLAAGILLTGIGSAPATALEPKTSSTAAPTAEDPIVIRSFDGTPIVARLMLPARTSTSQKVPAVLMTHGWGGKRPTGATTDNIEDVLVQRLIGAGYAVLSWDSRGFGQSGGEASPGGPAEVQDAQALIDYLSTRPEILQDAPGDPRIGWTGGSNAGGVQFNTAAVDTRIDAIAPLIAWGNLNQDLFPNGTTKNFWARGIAALGLVTSGSDGLLSPAGTQLGTLDPHITASLAEATLTGGPGTANRAWFQARSTTSKSSSIKAPTLIVQGTVDTFFPLEDGFENYSNLVAAGTPVKFIASCFGHTLTGCTYGPTQSDRDTVTGQVIWQDRLLDWMDRYVKRNTSVKTGPKVEWQANNGTYYSAPGLPLPNTTTVTSLPVFTGPLVGPGLTSGGDGIASGAPASPLELGVSASRSMVLAPSGSPRSIVGVPSVHLSGTSIGLTAQVHLELIDRAPDGTRITVDDQTMPWRFAGVINQSVDLHGIAWRLEPGHALELEVTTGSAQFDAPLTGPFTVDLTAITKIPVTPAS